MGKPNIFKAVKGKRQRTQTKTGDFSSQNTQQGTKKNQGGRISVFKVVPGIQTKGRYYEKGEPYQEEWLGMYRKQKEIILAWLSASSISTPLAEGEHRVRASWRYLLTSDRSMLVGFLKDHSVFLYELPSLPLKVEEKIGRDTIKTGKYQWKAALGQGRFYRELASLPSLDRMARIREAAGLNSMNLSGHKRRAEFALWLVKVLVKELGDPVDCLSEAYLEAVIVSEAHDPKAEPDIEVLRDPLSRCIEALYNSREEDGYLSRWAKDWNVSPEFQLTLASFLLKNYPQYPEPTISLFRQARSLKVEKDPLSQMERDIDFAQLFIEINKRDEAIRLIKNSLATLPEPTLEDLLPLPQTPEASSPVNTIRCRLLEALARTGADTNIPEPDAIAELARLQPLDTVRLEALIYAAKDPLRKRVQEMLLTLKENGLSPSSEPWISTTQVKPLSEEMVTSRLPYPDIAEEGTIDAIKTWIGKARVPDYNALKSYSERVTQKNYPEVLHGLTDACLALGVSNVEAYVTRGERSTGIRAYESKPSLLLIGIDHLEPESDFFMTPLELRFAIGTEVAHLRFQHTRLTSSEVWDGVLSTGRQAFEVIAVLSAPLALMGNAARGLQRLTGFQRLMQKTEIITSGIKRAADFAGFAKNVKDAAENIKNSDSLGPEELLEDEDNLLEACRQMQLTADRAGLILCGNFQAAVRAMFLTSRHYALELPIAIRYSLIQSLTRKDSKNMLLHKELALRVAALGSFYLSDDYEMLSEALIRHD